MRCGASLSPHWSARDGTDGTPGLADVEAVLSQSWVWLARPGAVVIELAPHQAEAAALMARGMGYVDVRVETGPGPASADAGRSHPVSGPRLIGPRRSDEALAALADGQVIAVPGDGGYLLAARHGSDGSDAALPRAGP